MVVPVTMGDAADEHVEVAAALVDDADVHDLGELREGEVALVHEGVGGAGVVPAPPIC